MKKSLMDGYGWIQWIRSDNNFFFWLTTQEALELPKFLYLEDMKYNIHWQILWFPEKWEPISWELNQSFVFDFPLDPIEMKIKFDLEEGSPWNRKCLLKPILNFKF